MVLGSARDVGHNDELLMSAFRETVKKLTSFALMTSVGAPESPTEYCYATVNCKTCWNKASNVPLTNQYSSIQQDTLRLFPRRSNVVSD